MGKYSTTGDLLSASWQVMKKDKAILFFPLCSLICCLLVSASFIMPWLSNMHWQPHLQTKDTSFYIVLFVFYFCNYLWIVNVMI